VPVVIQVPECSMSRSRTWTWTSGAKQQGRVRAERLVDPGLAVGETPERHGVAARLGQGQTRRHVVVDAPLF
jgi:hypothetical protein